MRVKVSFAENPDNFLRALDVRDRRAGECDFGDHDQCRMLIFNCRATQLFSECLQKKAGIEKSRLECFS
jgi:hypothetical protein